jgi:hypothetical protein
MEAYDPMCEVNSEEWLEMDDDDRSILIEDYHRQAGIRLPNLRLHVVFHTIVENQIAMETNVPAKETLGRLMADGLDRHEAIHAIGSVLAAHMHRLASKKIQGDPNQEYSRSLKELTAAKWKTEQQDSR